MKIIHCPQHIGTAVEHNLNSVKRLRPRSVGFTEMDFGPHSQIPVMRRILKGYRICADDKGGHSQEIPIAVKTGVFCKVQSIDLIQLSHDLGVGVGNDRWLNIVRYRYLRHDYAHVATHWNASIQNKDHGLVYPNQNDRAKAMVSAFQVMQQQITKLKNEDREVFVTGDFNYRTYNDNQFKLWEHSPQNLFKSLNMNWHEEGLDYLAWTKGMKLRDAVHVIPASQGMNESDHPWLVGRFKRA